MQGRCKLRQSAVREDGRWGPKMLEWQPRTGKRSVGRPPTSCTYDITRRRQPLDPSGTKRWNFKILQKTYVQQWTSFGSYDDDDKD
ncbi:jg14624 [Pararge aegeria aegeria]|uniref:Jg14624 protein n=1 Tax=Pararge aegeria aegeria TaxID=348720 RepID=A0A8S4RZJ0_9NEOP|nr:jg14624 [Pararge aegeria aegeria]